MMRHKASPRRDRMWDRTVEQTVWQTVDKLFHYRYVNCELLRNSQSEVTAIWGLGSGRKWNGQREGFTERLSLVRMQSLSWKKWFLWDHKSAHIMWPLTLTLSTPWTHAHLETIVCKFGPNPTICLREEAIFVPAQKCPDHVTLTLSTPWMHAHLCKFGRNRAICVVVEAICAKRLQVDGQTDDGRRTIALAHGMS